ncbi:hypothetical protein Patl1_29800 [Pistacia atlantica]|uniref:Uncharacterized protein n=1 Tax=Pistacia atlantica TaxID=434234 RepID=A0ACC1AE49_9ROSI|nr:hypothetical protein Patl1_29800 [Pistacia atlantica]
MGIIAARFASSRFQGKHLVNILGKPMIQRTWERSKLATTLEHLGDELLIEPEIIDLQAAPDVVFSTAITSLKPEDAFDPNQVKCQERLIHSFHICFILEFSYSVLLLGQSYDSKFQKIYLRLQPTSLQLEEDLEQLKVLENGYKMKVIDFFSVLVP